MDYFAQHSHNCMLVDLESMLNNGTVISETLIEKPHSFSTACNIATQIMAQIASNQYGGQTETLSHLAPFVDVSRKRIRQDVAEELADVKETLGDKFDAKVEEITERRVREEIKRGVQTIQYQITTLMTTNGQTPFVTIYMYLGEVPEGQTRDDLAMIIEEVLLQRIQGTKNEKGVWITPAFPKLVYVLEPENITEDSKYWYLTELAAQCTAKRMVPDYVSEKKILEFKYPKENRLTVKQRRDLWGDEAIWGKNPLKNLTDEECDELQKAAVAEDLSVASDVVEKHGLKKKDVLPLAYPPMGCRSFLTPDPIRFKTYGRFNQGVVTINLVDVALSADKDFDQFWTILEERLELCHKALQLRHQRLEGTVSDVSPIHWRHGGIARLEKGKTIDKLLYNGYSTISLGYAGLYECVLAMTGKSHTDEEAKPFALEIMQKMNDKCKEWKEAECIDYSLYGTPIESTTYKFAKCLQKRFGVIPGVTNFGYITNSYHVNVREKIDPFTKLEFEAAFQRLSPGGAISYIETSNLDRNIEAVLEVLKFIYEHIIYAELNTKSDFCQVCSYDGEILIDKNDEGKLIWKCPNCGNTDQNKMNVARRTCGYIGSQFWNQGRTEEIRDRVVHLGGGD